MPPPSVCQSATPLGGTQGAPGDAKVFFISHGPIGGPQPIRNTGLFAETALGTPPSAPSLPGGQAGGPTPPSGLPPTKESFFTGAGLNLVRGEARAADIMAYKGLFAGTTAR